MNSKSFVSNRYQAVKLARKLLEEEDDDDEENGEKLNDSKIEGTADNSKMDDQ